MKRNIKLAVSAFVITLIPFLLMGGFLIAAHNTQTVWKGNDVQRPEVTLPAIALNEDQVAGLRIIVPQKYRLYYYLGNITDNIIEQLREKIPAR